MDVPPGTYFVKGTSICRASLDAIDRKILKELQDDGRMTNVELARRVGISAPPCLRRVRALEEAGFIKGYRALLDEKQLGYEVTVFAMVHLSSQAEADLSAFEDFVRKQPLVRECWMLSGEIDFVLKCVAPDLKTFQAFVEKLTAAPERAQRQNLADAAPVQGRGDGADGVAPERSRSANPEMTIGGNAKNAPEQCPAISDRRHMKPRALLPLDLLDLIALAPPGALTSTTRALGLADQRARQRRGDRDAALLGVRFRLADDLPHRLLRRCPRRPASRWRRT